MDRLLGFLSDTALFPHGFCLAWQPELIWLHVSSDAVIALAYFGIAAALAVFVSRRDDLALGWMFWMFALFILACGLTHAIEIWALWQPVYGLQGVVKAITAVASIMTAILLWPLIPRVLAMPTPAELRRVSRTLDVTVAQKTRTEEALRASEHRHELLVNGVTDYALIMLDPRGRVAEWNRGAERIKGYAAREIVGDHFSRFYAPEDRDRGEPARALETAEREGRYEAEGWRVRKDGSRFWANIVMDAMRDDHGQLIGYAKITRDITDKRDAAEAIEQTRAALAQAQKMEAIGQLTGGIAHDFNNLLSAVLGSVELLERREAFRGADALRFLSTARKAAERGAELTHRLLAFARKQTLEPQPTDANRLVADFSELLRRTLGESIAVQTMLADELWTTHIDRNQLENALLNLAVNARDAMPEGGRLTIETANLDLDAASAGTMNGDIGPGQYVTIAVSDTGTGMTEDVLSRAFEPFFTTKADGRGTGLGLSQVFGFIKQSGGHVTLATEPGHGTVVTFYLPRHLAEPSRRDTAVAQPDQPHEPIGHGETVLLVEDDEQVRGTTTEAVAELGFRVLVASDAEAALRILDDRPEIALLFTDIGLPGRDGRQLAEEAVRRRPGLRVVLATGYTNNVALGAGQREHRFHLLAKPFAFDVLAAKLREVMRRS
jgi:PAS domain S-box-containing protein